MLSKRKRVSEVSEEVVLVWQEGLDFFQKNIPDELCVEMFRHDDNGDGRLLCTVMCGSDLEQLCNAKSISSENLVDVFYKLCCLCIQHDISYPLKLMDIVLNGDDNIRFLPPSDFPKEEKYTPWTVLLKLVITVRKYVENNNSKGRQTDLMKSEKGELLVRMDDIDHQLDSKDKSFFNLVVDSCKKTKVDVPEWIQEDIVFPDWHEQLPVKPVLPPMPKPVVAAEDNVIPMWLVEKYQEHRKTLVSKQPENVLPEWYRDIMEQYAIEQYLALEEKSRNGEFDAIY